MVSVSTQTLKEYNKITISKSVFKYNCNRISRLQSELAKINHEKADSKNYADELEKAMILSQVRHFSEIDALNKKIEEFESFIAAQKLEIKELKANCQNEYEMEKLNIELVEQIDDAAVEQFPEIHMRESFKKMNPTIMKTFQH